jgi:tetratricopeptide (TPR) repeat protein
LGGDGVEVDWFVGYSPPAEDFQASLETILKGEKTFKALQAAQAANPRDVAALIGIGRKWEARDDMAKALEKYREVIALDPDGKGGVYTDEETLITAPCTEFARYSLAMAAGSGSKRDTAPIKAFIAENPKSRLVKLAYQRGAGYYASAGTKDEAAGFFSEYAARFPDDPEAWFTWLRRIIRDKGPIEKGVEVAARLRELAVSSPNPIWNQAAARFYDLQGEKSKSEEVFGRVFMERRVADLATSFVDYANYWADKKENLESATAMAEMAVKLQPGETWFLRQAAYVNFMAGNEARALELYGPAWLQKHLAGPDPFDIRSYAIFWTRAGKNLESALAAAKKTVELQPKTDYFWSTLSDVYAKMGNKAQAIKAAEKAVEVADPQAKPPLQKKLDALKAPAAEKK